MFKLVRVNMKTKTCQFEALPSHYSNLGGRALTSAIVNREVSPTSTPIGPHNKLVFSPGLLGGTFCPNSGRISVGAKSPLTGGIKESNSGGQAGGYLAKMGIMAIVVEDQAPEGQWFKLELSADKADLKPAEALSGLNNWAAVEKLVGEHGSDCAYITIGRAGEFKLTAASIAFTDKELRPARHAGRGGLGAVMGSKGLKAIVVNPEGCEMPPIKDQETFTKASKLFAKLVMGHPASGKGMAMYGTAEMVNVINEAGGLPTRNFRSGRFEQAELVSGETLNKVTVERGGEGRTAHGCMTGCIIRCSGLYPDKDGKLLGKWPEYETLWSFGPDLGIADMDMIVRFDRMCDDIGVDTIDVGAAIGVAMEAGVIDFGDVGGVLKLMEEVSEGSALGRVIGCGAETTGRVYGVRRVPTVKGQSMPAYDPRAVKGNGVTYATSPMGADHTAGYAVVANIFGLGGWVNPLGTEGQTALSRKMQIFSAFLDSAGLCLFTKFPFMEQPETFQAVVDMLNAKYGSELIPDDLTLMGQRVLEDELDFNRRAGFTSAHDRLPDFFVDEALPPHGCTFDISPEDLDSTLKW